MFCFVVLPRSSPTPATVTPFFKSQSIRIRTKNHTTDTSIWTEWTPERPSFRTTHQFSIEIIPFMFYEMIMRMTTMMMMMFLYDILINFTDCSLQHFVSGALSVSAPTPAITALPFAFTTL